MGRYVVGFSFIIFFKICYLFVIIHGASASDSSELTRSQNNTMVELSKFVASFNPIWAKNFSNPCIWVGVSCTGDQVVNLSLYNFNLSIGGAAGDGRFFDLLCNLSSLQSLDLSRNQISIIPKSSISRCVGLTNLKHLNLSSNSLSGNLPNISQFGALEHLDLSFNSLSGNIDTQLDALAHLKSLNLSFNNFTGRLGGGRNLALEELVLSDNGLEGQIRIEISNYMNLTLLDLSLNKFSGSLPHEFEKLSKLITLLVSSNNLYGAIPSSLSSIKTLHRFAANQNGFKGTIPPGVTRYLSVLDLSYNHLTGGIPENLLSYPQLESVDLTSNELEGNIPTNFSRSLYRLRLGGNNMLSGTIPQSISNLSKLQYLELDQNQLDGNVPLQLGSCKGLTLLNLANNRLQGGLPAVLGKLTNLVVMKLQMNNLTGKIPDEFSNMPKLSILNLSRNSFSGEIPVSISSLQKLAILDLSNNRLNGSIPDAINGMELLLELQLGNNQLNGTIPEMPTSLSTALNLSENHLSGPIPYYLGNLQQLEILDISRNNFTGSLPTSLSRMYSLTLLNLSYNQLSGILPTLPKGALVVYDGNRGLTNNSASSPMHPVVSRKRSHVWVTVLAVIGAMIVLFLILAPILFMVSRRLYRIDAEVPVLGENPPQIINGRFITSNSIHRSSIDFDRAMEAIGNPANISLKTRFSTYYKAVMPSGVSYSVKKLNWGDKIFQTANYKRFEQELDVLGKLSNSTVMVPLAYVVTADSAYLFYEHVHKGTVFDFLHKGSENVLDWPSRYSIAVGVAQGLTFLHGCTQPVLLLDLTTKSIHLKSSKEPQIGDIELCKVIDPSKSTGSLSTVAGSVGYVPPEYAYTMRLTMAGNVYSFGVILLELLTGKPPVGKGVELAKWASSFSARNEGTDQILDSRVCRASLAVRSQMLSVLKIALSCVKLSADARPKMRTVVRMLYNAK